MSLNLKTFTDTKEKEEVDTQARTFPHLSTLPTLLLFSLVSLELSSHLPSILILAPPSFSIKMSSTFLPYEDPVDTRSQDNPYYRRVPLSSHSDRSEWIGGESSKPHTAIMGRSLSLQSDHSGHVASERHSNHFEDLYQHAAPSYLSIPSYHSSPNLAREANSEGLSGGDWDDGRLEQPQLTALRVGKGELFKQAFVSPQTSAIELHFRIERFKRDPARPLPLSFSTPSPSSTFLLSPSSTFSPIDCTACGPCRSRKVKCEGGFPHCRLCLEKARTEQCVYRSVDFGILFPTP